MRSSVSLGIMLLLAGCGSAPTPASARPPADPAPSAARAPSDMPAEVAEAQGPSGTAGSGAQRYDTVGMATWYGEEVDGNATASGETFDPQAISAAHRTLPLGSIAEVTALDSGRTILVRINDRGPGDPRYEIDLSRGAADLLGSANGATPVRVRAVTATPQDDAALRAGRPASPRMDAPPALLAALRRQLGPGYRAPVAAAPAKPVRRSAVAAGASYPPPGTARRPAAPSIAPPRPAVPPAPRPAAGGRFLVQVAAFSTETRARDLARSLGGSVQPAGALWRVRLGPFRDRTEAQRARDGAARRGYGDAQVILD